jgi:hypothetical protein
LAGAPCHCFWLSSFEAFEASFRWRALDGGRWRPRCSTNDAASSKGDRCVRWNSGWCAPPTLSPFAVVAGPRGLIEINSDVEVEAQMLYNFFYLVTANQRHNSFCSLTFIFGKFCSRLQAKNHPGYKHRIIRWVMKPYTSCTFAKKSIVYLGHWPFS